MSMDGLHDFHFVMDRKMKNKLTSLDYFKGCKSVSGMIVNILKVLTPAIGKEHKWGKQRFSRYRAVCDDSEEIREHVHVYFPGEMYRELKLLHQDLNFYSIAQLLREVIDFFLGLVDMYRDEVFQELEKSFAHWRSEDEQTRQTPREFLLQLWKLIQFLPGKNRLVTVYNNKFTPFWILRI